MDATESQAPPPEAPPTKVELPEAPDRNINTVFWISLLGGLIGLDHLYLRSPRTALLKGLTLGGLGFWWLLDILQLVFDKRHTLLYGLSAPFNWITGIGLGQMTPGPSAFAQRTDYFTWCGSAILDLFGLTALIEGRPAAFLRRMVDAVLLFAFASAGTIFGYLMAVIFAFFTLVPAFFTLRAIFDPAELAKKGAPIPANLVKLLNFFESWTDMIGPNATAVVRHDFGLAAVNAKQAPKTFGYGLRTEIEAEAEAAATQSEPGNKKELLSWPISMLLGNVFGGMVMGIVGLFTWIPQVKLGLMAADGYFAAVRASRGETPDAPDLGSFLPVGGIAGDLLKGGLKGAVGKMAGDVTSGLVPVQGLRSQLQDARTAFTSHFRTPEPIRQEGGARNEGLSTEATVLGATVIALIAGGAIKIAVDSLVEN